MSEKTMADVLAEHAFVDGDACDCNAMFYDTRLSVQQIKVEHGIHVEERLDAAGYGDVREARAGALEDAAEAWQVRMDTIGRGSVEAKTFMQVRAASERGRGAVIVECDDLVPGDQIWFPNLFEAEQTCGPFPSCCVPKPV